MKRNRQNLKKQEILTNYAYAVRAILLSFAVVGLALLGFFAVMKYVNDDNSILVYARRNLLISLAGASAFYVILVGLMTWVVLRFMKSNSPEQ